MPPLRAQQCTQRFYKTSEASNGPPETTRDTHNNLSGRHVDNGTIKGGTGQPSGRNPTVLATLGVRDQPREICALPRSHHPILRLHGGLSPNDDLPTLKKVEDIAKACQAALLQGTLSVRVLSRLIGQMSATMQAVLPVLQEI